jgi:hypothetical protein
MTEEEFLLKLADEYMKKHSRTAKFYKEHKPHNNFQKGYMDGVLDELISVVVYCDVRIGDIRKEENVDAGNNSSSA